MGENVKARTEFFISLFSFANLVPFTDPKEANKNMVEIKVNLMIMIKEGAILTLT